MNGFTPLHRAARAGDLETVHELLMYGADPNVIDNAGVAPIHRAARDRKYDLVTELVRYSANLDLKTNTGWTPLHLAMRSGDLEMVNLLLGYGAALHIPLPDGTPPLTYAAAQDEQAIVDAILVRAETPDAQGKTLDVNATNAEGDTALHVATRSANTSIAISLLVMNADPTIVNKANESPFYYAVRDGLEDLASVMLENGASVMHTTPNGVPMMQYAQQSAPESMVEVLAAYLPQNRAAETL